MMTVSVPMCIYRSLYQNSISTMSHDFMSNIFFLNGSQFQEMFAFQAGVIRLLCCWSEDVNLENQGMFL
ncbi:MAG: hypothetical protein AMK70_06945 [Nitrospira bacterium SG8_35_1]|nr:MAG: hypothetical protein AMK70_06945 [Nitrospira bacterium SG8_35_1]